MAQSLIRSVRTAGVALIGLCSLASSAWAVTGLPNASDFQISESCQAPGCSGTFTVVDNSTQWYIYGFDVGNAQTTSDGTTQTNWAASIVSGFAFAGSTENAFQYGNPTAPVTSDLANDVGPGQSSNLFTFSTAFLASPYTINLVNSGGFTTTVSGTSQDVPEPASLAIIGGGLVGVFGVTRRRRLRARA